MNRTVQTAFLESVKNQDERLYRLSLNAKHLRQSKDLYDLSHSSVAEPTDLLLGHITEQLSDRDRFKERLAETNAWGQVTLRQQIGRRYAVGPERVLLTTGASDAIFLVCQALLLDGGHVIIEQPVYQPLLAAPRFLGASVDFLARPPENEYRVDMGELKKRVRHDTRLIILSNLHNPSGALIDSDILQEVASIAHDVGAKVLVDEIYHDFVEADQQPAAALDDVFISISSLSKVYGLSVLRCGWVVASGEVIEQVRRVYVLVENIGSRFIETLASTVFDRLDQYKAHGEAILARNRGLVEAFSASLSEKGLLSHAKLFSGCVYFPRLPHVQPGAEMLQFIHRLETQYRVIVVPGHFFGADTHVRIGLGGDTEELTFGLDRLAEAIGTWKSA